MIVQETCWSHVSFIIYKHIMTALYVQVFTFAVQLVRIGDTRCIKIGINNRIT